MKDMGIDISQKKTQDVFDLYKQGRRFNYVITVCDEANSERCPLFPGISQKLHWSFPDPSNLLGTMEENLIKTIEIRNQISNQIVKWLTEPTTSRLL